MTKRFLFSIPILLLVGIAVYFILTTSPLVRYWADDFCAAIPVRNGGFWGAQVGWWLTWTGRYSSVAFQDLFEMMGPMAARFLPVIIFALMTIALIPVFFFDAILAPLFVVLALINASNLIQTFYWQAGSLNYAFEFIFLNLFLSLLIWPKIKFVYVLVFTLSLIAGGFSEAFALAQTVLIFFILLIIVVGNFADKNLRIKLLVTGLVGSILSLGIMFLSPGNAVRLGAVTHPPSLLFVIKSTIYGTKWYFERMLLVNSFLYSLVLIATGSLITVNNHWSLFKKLFFGIKKTLLIMIFSILGLIFSTASVIFSGYYSMSITPPERTMFIAIYTIILFFFVFSFSGSILVTNLLKNQTKKFLIWIATIIFIAATYFLVSSTINHWQKIKNDLSSYATEWDLQEKIILKEKQLGNVPIIKNITPVGELDGFVENGGWVLGCVKSFYQLKEIKLDMVE